MDNKEYKNKVFEDVLQYAIEVAAKEMIDEMPEAEKVEFSDRHNKQMKKLFNLYHRKIITKKIPVYAKRVAVFFILFIMVSGVTISSVQALRVRFLNYIMSITQTNTEINLKDDDISGDSYSTDYITFDYIPEGFKLDESNVYEENDLYISFKKDNFNFDLTVYSNDNTLNIDTEDANVRNIKINNCDGIVSEKDDIVIIFWYNDERSYVLSGNFDVDKMYKIAENIK